MDSLHVSHNNYVNNILNKHVKYLAFCFFFCLYRDRLIRLINSIMEFQVSIMIEGLVNNDYENDQ